MQISKEYDITFWNFMDAKAFDKEDFYDADHLNRQGAYKLVSMLNDSILSLSN